MRALVDKKLTNKSLFLSPPLFNPKSSQPHKWEPNLQVVRAPSIIFQHIGSWFQIALTWYTQPAKYYQRVKSSILLLVHQTDLTSSQHSFTLTQGSWWCQCVPQLVTLVLKPKPVKLTPSGFRVQTIKLSMLWFWGPNQQTLLHARQGVNHWWWCVSNLYVLGLTVHQMLAILTLV